MHSVFIRYAFYLILFSLGDTITNQSAIVIVVYLLAMLMIGAWGLRLRGLEDFHLAGRKYKSNPAHRHLLCHNCGGFFHHWHGRPGVS